MHRLLTLALVGALAACSEPASELDAGNRVDGGSRLDASTSGDAALDARPPADAAPMDSTVDSGDVDSGSIDSGLDAGILPDAGSPDGGPPDGGERVFGVRVLADGACSELSFDPASIRVPAGTSFTVNWVNATGCTEIDVDMGGTVPIVLGLEPGASYHDTIREWCGTYTGTYVFRAYYSPSFPAYLDVDCSS